MAKKNEPIDVDSEPVESTEETTQEPNAAVKRTALAITSVPIVYSVNDAAIAKLKEQFGDIVVTTTAGYKMATAAIANLRAARVSIEKTRKALKDDVLKYGRDVDGEAKRLTAMIEAIEEPLKLAKQQVDDEKERIKREAEEKERLEREAEARRKLEAEEAAALKKRQEEEERLKAEREALEKERAEFDRLRKEQEAAAAAEKAKRDKEQAEAKRIADEREAKERADREAAEKAERDRVAKQQADEAERLRKEREEFEQEQRKMQAEREKIEAEKARLAQAEKDRIERERLERERIEREQAEREQAEREEAERKEREKVEQERRRKLKPDRDLIAKYADEIRDKGLPSIKDRQLTEAMKKLFATYTEQLYLLSM